MLTVRKHIQPPPSPPLGKSDHNLVFLQPQYTPRIQSQPTTTRSFRKWFPEAEEALRDCFESTDWNALQEPHSEDIKGATECITDYLNFCRDTVLPIQTVRCFPNNKPWITSDIKDILNRKKRAFRGGDREEMKQAQREFKVRLREAKESYSRKVEQKLQQNNTREVWEGMKTITSCKKTRSTADGDTDRANQFNKFFNRFHCDANVSTPCSTP